MATQVENRPQTRLQKPGMAQQVRSNGLQLGIITVAVGLWIVFIIGAPETFLKGDIYRALMTSIPYWGVIAIPLTLVVVAREIDLSFISIMGVGMVVFWNVFDWTDSLGVAFFLSLVDCNHRHPVFLAGSSGTPHPGAGAIAGHRQRHDPARCSGRQGRELFTRTIGLDGGDCCRLLDNFESPQIWRTRLSDRRQREQCAVDGCQCRYDTNAAVCDCGCCGCLWRRVAKSRCVVFLAQYR